jgi:hypothetical protein
MERLQVDMIEWHDGVIGKHVSWPFMAGFAELEVLLGWFALQGV